MKKQILIIGIIIMLVCIGLSGCFDTYAGERRTAVSSLIISSDGIKLISITEDVGYNSGFRGETNGPSFQMWNTSSGDLILDDIDSYNLPVSFSPNGKYLIKGSYGPISLSSGEISDVISGEKIAGFTNKFITWSKDGNFFFTAYIDELLRYHNLTMWDAKTFTKVITIPINRYYCHIAVSPDATKFICINGENLVSITTFNLTEESGKYLWTKNFFIDDDYPNSEIQWTNNDEIEVFYYLNNTLTLMIWNASDGGLLSEIQIENLSGFDGVLFSKNSENYLGYDRDNNVIKLFNKSSIEKTIQFNSNDSTVFAWSSEGNIIAMGNMSGIIEIRNASTGEVINVLMTPMRKAYHQVPAPSIAYLLIILIVLGLFWKRKRKL